MKCVLPECPVAFGECDRDNACYIFRCEHNAGWHDVYAPAPEPAAAATKDDLSARFAALMLVIAAARLES